MGDENPLPSFSGDPLLLPLRADGMETLDLYWDELNEANKISVAVKTITLDGSSSSVIMRNKY